MTDPQLEAALKGVEKTTVYLTTAQIKALQLALGISAWCDGQARASRAGIKGATVDLGPLVIFNSEQMTPT